MFLFQKFAMALGLFSLLPLKIRRKLFGTRLTCINILENYNLIIEKRTIIIMRIAKYKDSVHCYRLQFLHVFQTSIITFVNEKTYQTTNSEYYCHLFLDSLESITNVKKYYIVNANIVENTLIVQNIVKKKCRAHRTTYRTQYIYIYCRSLFTIVFGHALSVSASLMNIRFHSCIRFNSHHTTRRTYPIL